MSDAIAVLVPRMNTNDDQAVLVSWLVTSGSRVTADQPVAVLETTKSTFEVNAPADGYLFFELGTKIMVDVGAMIAWVSDVATAPAAPAAVRPVSGSAITSSIETEERFSRKALRLMKERGLTAEQFPAGDRIELADVERFLANRGPTSPAAPEVADGTSMTTEPLEQTPSKMIEAATLERVYRNVVPSTVVVSVDEGRLQARLKSMADTSGPISLMELSIYEAASLLAGIPELNGYYANGRAHAYRHVAIGFAINAGQSLKVPVLRNCQAATPMQIARDVRDLSLRYMRDELHAGDLTGGTFTVTDLSAQGVVQFIPVLNDRQSAILGICAVRPGAASRDLVLTFDHRMSDGMRAAEFLGLLRERLEA
jgi:pyruvate/2-oxoglutarate dehydrogenase complex dihydrolipoamide acyltransferase (E2) component